MNVAAHGIIAEKAQLSFVIRLFFAHDDDCLSKSGATREQANKEGVNRHATLRHGSCSTVAGVFRRLRTPWER
jgi:hypothetical protein